MGLFLHYLFSPAGGATPTIVFSPAWGATPTIVFSVAGVPLFAALRSVPGRRAIDALAGALERHRAALYLLPVPSAAVALILGLVLIESLVIYVLLISLILFFLKPFSA